MSLRNAILGLLSQRPMTGFDLLREFDVSRSVIWPAPQNEVYRVLAALKAEGMITEVAAGARGARTYDVTPDGRAALVDWLASESDYTLRYDPILKAAFLREAPSEVRQTRATADLAFFESQLAKLEERDKELREAPAAEDPRGDARRMAIALYRALAGWARAILAAG